MTPAEHNMLAVVFSVVLARALVTLVAEIARDIWG